jgi:hypothetical protein
MYFHYKLFIHKNAYKMKMTNSRRASRGPVVIDARGPLLGRGPAVEKLWCRRHALLSAFNTVNPRFT